ncbi:hypothetical protein K491DRAFT_719585 [Lophiostoma macrostomum CBS 122681]|uniref:Heterokaryon incompatibility protein n=1 Tax=Lophiostoma macrostomum CBS 122681 TaxID=1314788 RepID=A0A6A6SZK0_9PLEO|nr:hypothetical protein K491DRAFT_719585 [Lophiostoma macrostomum CBS 122681]
MAATDDRDHIYAFLGSRYAQDESGKPFVEVEYAKSTKEVHVDTARTLLKHPDNGPWTLTPVYHQSPADLLDGSRPSWVPSWNGGKRETRVIGNLNFRYEAGGSQDSFAVRILKENILEIKGFLFDKIVWMSPVLSGSDFGLRPELWNKSIHTKGELFLDSSWSAASHDRTLDEDEFTFNLVQGYPLDSNWNNLEQHRASFDAYRRIARSLLGRTSAHSSAFNPPVDVIHLAVTMAEHTTGKRLFLTENGRIGLAPGGALEIGDKCFIFLGVSVPLILKQSKKGRYKLVSECYIHDIMNGRLVEQMEAGKYTTERVLLE